MYYHLIGICGTATFKVAESQVSPNGVFIVNYERAGEVKMGEPLIEQND